MTTPAPDFRALCAELLDELQYQTSDGTAAELQDRARAALATPPPEPPTDEERLADFAQWLAGEMPRNAVIGDPLWGRSTVEPAPVSERPWEREGWCDAKGSFWAEHISRGDTASWRYASCNSLGGWAQRCLPHWALPLPQQEGEVTP